MEGYVAIAVRELELSRVTEGGLQLASVLREIRKARGWTQREVAERWSMTVDGYRPYEQGRRQLRWTQVPGLARALDIPELDLAERLGMQMPPPSDEANLRTELARNVAALAATELADLLGELQGLDPAAWRDVIETWRTQGLPRRDEDDAD